MYFCLQEFQAAKKDGAGVMSRLADSFHNMSAAYMMKNRDVEFDDITAYINAFADKLAVTDRVSQRLLKEQYGKPSVVWNNTLFFVLLILYWV